MSYWLLTIGERTKCFDDAERKRPELMQSWDNIFAGENTPGWKDHANLRRYGRLASKGGPMGSVIIQPVDHTAGHRHIGKDERLVFILNVEIVDCPEVGITAAVRLQPP